MEILICMYCKRERYTKIMGEKLPICSFSYHHISYNKCEKFKPINRSNILWKMNQ